MTMIWSERGYASLSGRELELYEDLDSMFLNWAREIGAEQYSFPNLICSADLQRINYFESFGHLATTVQQGEEVLTPAACYHFYSALKGTQFENTRYFTTRANCFRRECEYIPLQRQWCFGMREIVCIGTAAATKEFLRNFRESLPAKFAALGLNVQFQVATDPFFNPESNPKYIMQKIDPVKHEMILDGKLAIGSLNNHRTTFGEAFDITVNGQPASSACVAFGIERWMYALLQQGAA